MQGMSAPTLNPRMFRAYDIRGLAGKDLTPETARLIGRAYGTWLRRERGGRTVAIGRDSRPSSPALSTAVIDGLRTAGVDVISLGLAPSPLVYYAVAAWGLDGGLSITASHNPVEFNGMKLVQRGADPLLPEEIQAVYAQAVSGNWDQGPGTLTERDPRPEYLALLERRFLIQRPLKVVVDPGNGVATLTGPKALRRIGCEVVGLFTDLREGFPNHLPDPQEPGAMAPLMARVVRERADFGIAWDGDGDRVGLVDETGARYEPDWIVALLARDLLQRHPGARILVDVKTSRSPVADIEAHGGRPVFTRTGYSLFRRKMRDDGILFGGEASGHIVFAEDYFGVDDGVYAACAIAHVLAASDRPLSAHFAHMRRLVTSPEIKLLCPDDAKFRVAEAVGRAFRETYPVWDIDGARIDFGAGWALVRGSNTNPYLSLRIEAETPAGYEEIRARLWQVLARFPEVTIPPDAGVLDG